MGERDDRPGFPAVFSPCRQYRYLLWREWDAALPYMMVIGLNPSTADETADDPTLRRCIRFARDGGFGALCMANLFAFRATDPREMKLCPAPWGPDNDTHLLAAMRSAGRVVAAWGSHGSFWHRDREVRKLARRADVQLHALGFTKDGQPRHPLYLPASATPTPWPAAPRTPSHVGGPGWVRSR